MHIEIIQRKKGKMYKAHVRKGGMHLTRTFERKYDAQVWAREAEGKFEEGFRPDLKFQALAEEWLENHSKTKNAPSYYLSNQAKFAFVLPVLGQKCVREMTYKNIELLIRFLLHQKSGCTARTVNSYLAFVRAVCNYGVQRGDLPSNPVKKEHFFPEVEGACQYWQLAEANAFLQFIRKKYAEFYHDVPLVYSLALNTGMRFGEIAALKWDAVLLHSNNPSITVKRSVCPRTKVVRETTKGKKVRHIGINSVLLQDLQNASQRRTNDFVVHSRAGEMLDRDNFIKRYYAKDLRESGVSAIRFHDMRHTYASLFVMQGGSLYDLQKILGHQDMSTTERYAHLAQDYLLKKANIVVVGEALPVP